MLVTDIIARKGEYIADYDKVEYLPLSWEELRKRRLRAVSDSGRTVDILLKEGDLLRDGDLLAVDGDLLLVVKLTPEKVLVMKAETPAQFGLICYELGNRHLPAWIGQDEVLVLDDPVLPSFLIKQGITFTTEERVLDQNIYRMVGGGNNHHHNQQWGTVG
jgi:urease accessory protein